MWVLFTARIAAVALLGSMAIGCTQQEDAAARQQVAAAPEFDNADKAAARALSIGNTLAIQNARTPYERALLCTAAMDAVRTRLAEVSGASAAQAKLIQEIREIYFQRLNSIGAAEGKSGAVVRADLTKTAGQDTDTSEQARIALGCARELQNSQSSGK